MMCGLLDDGWVDVVGLMDDGCVDVRWMEGFMHGWMGGLMYEWMG